MENYVDFAVQKAVELLAIDSPTGYTAEAEEFVSFIADQGAEQCGFCNPGFIMNVLALEDELENPTEEDMKEYLAGNLCRCSGYESQLRAVKEYLKFKMEGKA